MLREQPVLSYGQIDKGECKFEFAQIHLEKLEYESFLWAEEASLHLAPYTKQASWPFF